MVSINRFLVGFITLGEPFLLEMQKAKKDTTQNIFCIKES